MRPSVWQASLAVTVACTLLTGCGAGAGVAMLGSAYARPQAHFALGMVTPGVAEPAPAAPASTDRGLSPIRLVGRAYVPQTLDDVRNVQDGYVSGSPVRVFDAASGRLLAQTVTYYDGSFMVDIALPEGQRAVLVTGELVGKGEDGKSLRLMAPTLLVAGSAEQRVVLSPGSTALVGFLSNLALEQSGEVAPEAIPALSLEGDQPEHVSGTLSGLISVFGEEARQRFAQLAELAPELQEAGSLNGLQSGIQRYIGRLARSAVKTTKP